MGAELCTMSSDDRTRDEHVGSPTELHEIQGGLEARAKWKEYEKKADECKREGNVKMELYYCKLLVDYLMLAAPMIGEDIHVKFLAEAEVTWKKTTYWVHRWVKRVMEHKGEDNPVVRTAEFHKMRGNLVVACYNQSRLSRFDEVIETADLFLEVKPAEPTMEELNVRLLKGVARYFLGLPAAVHDFDIAVQIAQQLNCAVQEAQAWFGKGMGLKMTDRHQYEEDIQECFSRYEELLPRLAHDREHVEGLFAIHPKRYEHQQEKNPETEIRRLEEELVGEESPIRLAYAHLTLGYWFLQQREFLKAEENLKQAIKHKVRLNSDSVYQVTAQLPILAPAYQLLQLCLAHQGKTLEALMWAERARARTMRFGLLNQPPKSDGDGGYCGEFEGDDSLAQEKIMGALSGCKGSIVAVEYSFVQSNLLIWVLKPGSPPTVHQVISDPIDFPCQLDENQASLKAMESVQALLNKMKKSSDSDKATVHELSFFHKLLIEPIKQELAGCDTVIFIPVQALHRLPWTALIDQHQKDGEKILIQRHAVAIAPSLLALGVCSDNLEKITSSKNEFNHDEILVVANPWPLSLPNLLPLSSAVKEAAAIVKLVKAYTGLVPTVCKGEAATRETVIENLPRAKWVHIAGHNTVNSKYNAGALMLAQPAMNHIVGQMVANVSWFKPVPGETPIETTSLANGAVLRTRTNFGSLVGQPMDENTTYQERVRGVLSAQQLTHCRLQAYGVVLSACSTADGVLIGDEGILGMARALLVAGAPAVLLSLWDVQDVATSKLMTQLYRNLITGRDLKTGLPYDLAFAHRQAILSMIGKKGIQVRDWSAFQMIGAPDVIFPSANQSGRHKGFGWRLQKPDNAILIPLVIIFCSVLVAILSRIGTVVGEI